MVERAVRAPKLLNPPRIGDNRLDLEPVADDAGIAHQAFDLRFAEAGDPVDLEIGKRGAKGGTLLQHRQLGQSSLVDFEGQALEQHRFITRRKPVFAVVIGPVQRWLGAATQ